MSHASEYKKLLRTHGVVLQLPDGVSKNACKAASKKRSGVSAEVVLALGLGAFKNDKKELLLLPPDVAFLRRMNKELGKVDADLSYLRRAISRQVRLLDMVKAVKAGVCPSQPGDPKPGDSITTTRKRGRLTQRQTLKVVSVKRDPAKGCRLTIVVRGVDYEGNDHETAYQGVQADRLVKKIRAKRKEVAGTPAGWEEAIASDNDSVASLGRDPGLDKEELEALAYSVTGHAGNYKIRDWIVRRGATDGELLQLLRAIGPNYMGMGVEDGMVSFHGGDNPWAEVISLSNAERREISGLKLLSAVRAAWGVGAP